MLDFTKGRGAKETSPSKFLKNTFDALTANTNIQLALAKAAAGANLEVVIENQDGMLIGGHNAGLISKMIKINAIVGVIAGFFLSKGIKVKLAAKQAKWSFDKIHADRKKNIIAKARSILLSGINKRTTTTTTRKRKSKPKPKPKLKKSTM